MAKQKTATKTKIDVPNVAPPSTMERNRKKSRDMPIRCCGNTVPVKDGVAGEADPKKIRARKRAALKRRGLREDEERVGA